MDNVYTSIYTDPSSLNNYTNMSSTYLKPSIWTKISGKIAKAVTDNLKARDVKENADSVTFILFGQKCKIKFEVE